MNGGVSTRALAVIAAALLLVAGSVAGYLFLHKPTPDDIVVDDEKLEHQITYFCGYCHAVPAPASFPRHAWRKEVEQGYGFFQNSGLSLEAPPLEPVVRYFEKRAPEELPPARIDRATTPCPVRFEQKPLPNYPGLNAPFISHVDLVHLSDPNRLEVLACDHQAGLVLALRLDDPIPKWRLLARMPHPARVTVVDLDRDGVNDLLVANLGSYQPTDIKVGSVVWLRGRKDGTYDEPITLLDGVGRVADVRHGEFRRKGTYDLVVAAFGLHTTGEIILLENETTDWKKPKFTPRVLDARHGAIHVPVADLDGDGKPDFVALIAQEHETIVAFMNEGDGKFRKETIYAAGDPSYGSSGIELVDLDGDGKLDVLYTNGDTLDRPSLLKPYHGVQWLQNRGKFPFTHHPIGAMYGVHRALAADLDGDGDLDIVAVSFLPASEFPQRAEMKLDAIVLFEQTEKGKFVRHTLEAGSCDHVSLAIGPVTGKGRKDMLVAGYGAPPGTPPVVLWRKLGK